ncbi:MAG: DNA polymerase III subunit alpha [Betaproteobacteria bacterium]|nr:DNA polymerase III subunit alpha [Betaproteobacteria bacterium]MDE2123352.1 DNA polymerase III subunit alpha [Betaproteobacteria bacterium]
MSYVHLRTHTEFSIVDGSLRVDAAVAAARADGQGALAITDLNNLFAAVRLYSEARGAGVKPIIGCDVRIAPGEPSPQAPNTGLLLLAANRQGYLNLCDLLSRAWLEGQRNGQAEVQWAWLEQEGLSAGLIALCGARHGAIGQALLAGDGARARLLAQRHASVFPGRFYLELQRSGHAECARHVAAAVRLAADLGLPVVATHPVQFLQATDFEAHEARVCIAEGETLGNPRRQRHFTADQYFKTQAEMQALFADTPSALANAVEIAKRCNLTLTLGRPQLPEFPTPHGMPMAAYFRAQSFDGLERRLQQLYPDATKREAQRARYAERLEFELGTIAKMGFEGYFLIVADFINWAKDNGCPVGPGRGSGAGSLVAYSLRITDLDPLAYNLLFERFLNPERVSMPDFDIDFCQENRDRVIDYVKQKFGAGAVSQIATFGTLAARAALRDVGRVQELGYNFCDALAKLIPNKPGQHITIAQAIEVEPQLKARMEQEDEVRHLLTLAQQLEGLPRNVGMHAGGVLIAPGKLTDFCPLYAQPGSTDAVSQFDKDDVEAIGLVKFDFLGLATLTILELAAQHIRRNHPDRAGFKLDDIPLDDPATYKLMARGDTVAVFQLESRGMQGMLREAKPDRFEDIIALVALYRPGPMDLIPSFCHRKDGTEPIVYPDPRMASVLEETYGIMVYQEQVMQVAQVIGGYSLGGADLLRRAMGKKKPEEMAKHRGIFAEGAAKNGIAPDKANEIFDLMEKFAGYGFNKSHAAAYALLAVQTAWLKAHCPAEFMAANMSIALDDTDKLKVLVDDARAMGLKLLPPDVNLGGWRFDPVDAHTIRYALGAIKGTGRAAIEGIVEARGDKPFASLMDFAARVDRTRINRRVLEALIRAGAFDAIDPNRATLMAAVGMALEHAVQCAEHATQGGLFDSLLDDASAAAAGAPAPEPQPPWDLRKRLSEEKLAIGFVLSGHLFDAHADEVRRFAPRPLAELAEAREPQIAAGIVAAVRVVQGQRGRMAIVTLEDRSGMLETVVNERLLDTVRTLLRDDELLVLQGRAQNDRFSGGLRFNVDAVWTLEQTRARLGRRIRLRVNGLADAAPLIELARTQSAGKDDGLPLDIEVERSGAAALLRLDRVRLRPGDDVLAELAALALDGRVQVVYDSGDSAAAQRMQH